MPGSQSLFEAVEPRCRLYLRYSKLHGGNRAFYGLREADLRALQGGSSFICFLCDAHPQPLIVPYAEYELVFRDTSPAPDGQYKVQVYFSPDATQLYVARSGRYNIDAHVGWNALDAALSSHATPPVPGLSHGQVQTLLGAIGDAKGFDIWVPCADRPHLDWALAHRFPIASRIGSVPDTVRSMVEQIDVIWTNRGSARLASLFEVEHTTPIYSGLLRFNDLLLVAQGLRPTFNVVAQEARREDFARQVARPTFATSGLRDACAFLDYVGVYQWYSRLRQERASADAGEAARGSVRG